MPEEPPRPLPPPPPSRSSYTLPITPQHALTVELRMQRSERGLKSLIGLKQRDARAEQLNDALKQAHDAAVKLLTGTRFNPFKLFHVITLAYT